MFEFLSYYTRRRFGIFSIVSIFKIMQGVLARKWNMGSNGRVKSKLIRIVNSFRNILQK